METSKNNRCKWLHLRLTEEEYALLQKRFKASAYKKFSEYTRRAVLSEPIIAAYKDQRLDTLVAELSRLRKDLNGIGNNVNQAVHKMHTLDRIPEYKKWLHTNAGMIGSLLESILTIRNLMDKITEKWLRS